jgi:hypothetical protein
MTTPLRRLYGGSDRPHHLAMSTTAAMPVAALAYHYGWWWGHWYCYPMAWWCPIVTGLATA